MLASQLFLSNWVILLCVAWVDSALFNKRFVDVDYLGRFLGLWAVFSLVTIPVWFIYLIWSL